MQPAARIIRRLERYKNKMQTYMDKARRYAFPALNWPRIPRPARASGLGHAAARVVGPVAVEADHAPFHAPACTDKAGILADPVVDRTGARVGNEGEATAKAAGNGIGRPAPGPVGRLTDAVDLHDEQGRLPEGALPLGEPGHDLAQHRRVFADRHHVVVARAGQPEILFQPTRGVCRRRRERRQRQTQHKSETQVANHRAPPEGRIWRLPAATRPRRRGPAKRPCGRDRTARAGRGLAATLGAPGRGQKKTSPGWSGEGSWGQRW